MADDQPILRIEPPRRLLAVVATELEASGIVRAIGQARSPLGLWQRHGLGDRLDLVVSGVGKANAAGATASCLDPHHHAGVVSLGIAGALPGSGLALGSSVVASASVFADEGLATPSGFVTCQDMGFALCEGLSEEGQAVAGDAAWVEALDFSGAHRGVIATVSTCSGTDARARAIAQGHAAIAEGMEGAAVGLAARRLGARFVEVRTISNTTGDRAGQAWDLDRAVGALGAWAARL